MKKLFEWYSRGPTKDMSESERYLGLTISIIIFLIALAGTVGVLLRITGFFNTDPPAFTTECFQKVWCYPTKDPRQKDFCTEYFKFQSDGTFTYNSKRSYAWGTWKYIGNDQIEIIYTQTPTEDELSKKILSMPNCTTLNVDDKVFTN